MVSGDKYLRQLAKSYPTIAAAATEIINLQAILNLPKGTEHFLTDIHGEYEAFFHVLKNGSGAVRRKIDDVFGNTLATKDKKELATLVYYPEEKMGMLDYDSAGMQEWYRLTLYRLIELANQVSVKYTRSKIRKALPKDFSYVIEELMTNRSDMTDQESYYRSIIETIIRIGRAREFIIAICELIQRLVVDHLHIVGDIYDRGPGPHLIMDRLCTYHSLDIQWGNHDVLWMGAAAGQQACIANVIRICARYGNLDILEDGYGINLLPLAAFAMRCYRDDPCTCFALKGSQAQSEQEQAMNRKLHKAISVIQFKIEGQLIKKRWEFALTDRDLLSGIDMQRGTVSAYGRTYPLLDSFFPTVDPADPCRLTGEEKEIMERLTRAFMQCERLQKHMHFLLSKGSLYKVYNNNLLYHGCMPLTPDGHFKEVDIYGRTYKGKALYDVLDSYVRKGFFSQDETEREKGRDMMWYIWLHENSPLFGKNKMATFERYFLGDPDAHKEKKNPYYSLLENEEVVDRILTEFGLSPDTAHIINGHVPVRQKDGENPVKCGGKVMVIDGGFSKAYQKETGIAGYTLIYNSYGLLLVAHNPFESTRAAIEKESDIHSEIRVVKRAVKRRLVGDTDVGRELKEQIADLEKLLCAYRSGRIAERM